MRDVENLRAEGFCDRIESRCVAIYALMKNGRVVYIGKSKNVWGRLGAHYATRRRGRSVGTTKQGRGFAETVFFEFDEVLLRYCFNDELDRLEANFINRYKPRFNVNLRNSCVSSVKIDISVLAAQMGWTRLVDKDFKRRRL